MGLSEVVAIGAVVLSLGTNIGLYVHLSPVMNSRFDAVDRKFESMERRLEMIMGNTHEIDLRVSKLESNQ